MTIDIQILNAPEVDPEDLIRIANVLTVVVAGLLIIPEEDVQTVVGQ